MRLDSPMRESEEGKVGFALALQWIEVRVHVVRHESIGARRQTGGGVRVKGGVGQPMGGDGGRIGT
jgi:hypothetical protein